MSGLLNWVNMSYHGTSEIDHGLCACMVNNPLTKAQRFSLRTGAKNHALSLTCFNHVPILMDLTFDLRVSTMFTCYTV